jgi:hypothetical protein
MWGSMPLMTMSTAVIIVLQSAEAVHVTHESWLSSDSRILIVPMSTLTQFQGVCQEITTRLFNGFIYLVTYPLRFHRPREHRTHPEAPSCALWVPAITALPTPSHCSTIVASLNIPAVCHRSFPAQLVGMPRLDSTMYYARPYPYRLMVVLFSWVVAPWAGP